MAATTDEPFGNLSDPGVLYTEACSLIQDSTEREQEQFIRQVIDVHGPDDCDDIPSYIQEGLTYDPVDLDPAEFVDADLSWRLRGSNTQTGPKVVAGIKSTTIDTSFVESTSEKEHTKKAPSISNTTFVRCVLSLTLQISPTGVERSESLDVAQIDEW